VTSMNRRRTSEPVPAVQPTVAVEALRYTPTAEDIAEARAEYLSLVATKWNLRVLDQFVDYDVLLTYRGAVSAIGAGEYDPEFRIRLLREAIALAVVVDVAETPAADLDKLSTDDRAFYDQVEQLKDTKRGQR
jgi:hypothetical protein